MAVSSILVRILGRHTLLNQALATSMIKLPEIDIVRVAVNTSSNELALWVILPSDEVQMFDWIQRHPQSRILLFSVGWDFAQVKTALHKGVMGCIFSNASLQELAEAVRQVARGENHLPPSLIKSLIMDEIEDQEESNAIHFDILTPREQDLIPLICQGLSNKQIAQKLYLSVRTIENHLSNIYKKLEVNSRIEVAVLSMQMGWVALHD